eukprot:8083651-Pyramimonas_sp.AAC.1
MQAAAEAGAGGDEEGRRGGKDQDGPATRRNADATSAKPSTGQKRKIKRNLAWRRTKPYTIVGATV